MHQGETVTLIAGQTLNCSAGGKYAGRKVVALLPVGYGAKCCARMFGNSGAVVQDYATTGVYAADGSTAADVVAFTPNPRGYDKVTVPAGSSPIVCWMDRT